MVTGRESSLPVRVQHHSVGRRGNRESDWYRACVSGLSAANCC
jgi:hypothetical protein